MSLLNLNQLGKDSQNTFSKYNKEEIQLTSNFKALFTKIIERNSKESVSFSDHTTIVHTPKELSITFPNQWFYIASFFVEYLIALKEYKQHYSEIFQTIPNFKAITKEIKESGEIPNIIETKISHKYKNQSEKQYFTKFLTDYEWWFGSKTIDRGDYYVSPILNLAKVVNVSQSYIAHLTHLLSENPQLLEFLHESKICEKAPLEYEQNEINVNLKEEFVDWFIERDGSKHNYYSGQFSSNREKLISELEKTEDIYEQEFGSSIFKINDGNIESLITTLEQNLAKNNGLFYEYSSGKSNHRPRAIVGKNNYIKFLKEILKKQGKSLQNYKALVNQIDFKLTSFSESLNKSGLIFSDQLIKRFIASLWTKPFVICSGLSGSGKTKLAQAFAMWICQDKSQYEIVPVGADWTNREPLLGYPNALSKIEYVTPENGVLQLILRAKENENLPFFLILDEMNLSHVERYFADFLSTMESGDTIPLHKIDNETNEIPQKLELPKNLFIIGTVNIDETTYMFSPKVLDRANTIEFRLTEDNLTEFINSDIPLDLSKLEFKGAAMGESFMDKATSKAVYDLSDHKDDLVNFFNELKKSGAEFGYRTTTEIGELIGNLEDLGEKDNTLLDVCIMQKLLPKLHGSRTKLSNTLLTLGGFCLKENKDIKDNYFTKFTNNELSEKDLNEDPNVLYKLSFEKICRMYKNAIENGFASYAEA